MVVLDDQENVLRSYPILCTELVPHRQGGNRDGNLSRTQDCFINDSKLHSTWCLASGPTTWKYRSAEAYLGSKVTGTARHKLLLWLKTRGHLYLTGSRTYPRLTCHSLNLHRCLLSWQVLCPLEQWDDPAILLFRFSAPVQWCSVVEDEQGTFSGLLLIRPFFLSIWGISTSFGLSWRTINVRGFWLECQRLMGSAFWSQLSPANMGWLWGRALMRNSTSKTTGGL